MDKTLHIKLNKKDVGRYAIIPGNPDRCEKKLQGLWKILGKSKKIENIQLMKDT